MKWSIAVETKNPTPEGNIIVQNNITKERVLVNEVVIKGTCFIHRDEGNGAYLVTDGEVKLTTDEE